MDMYIMVEEIIIIIIIHLSARCYVIITLRFIPGKERDITCKLFVSIIIYAILNL